MNLILAPVLIPGSMAALFIVQISNVVETGFLFRRASMSSALLIFFTLMAGILLGWSLHGHLLYRKSGDESGYLR
jgi:uncharacterized integral membrane protein